MGFYEIKEKARRLLHQTMKRPASYYETPGSAPRLVYVRVHTKWIEQGDLKGTNLSYAETEDTTPRIIFMRDEVNNPPRLGLVILSADEGYRIGQTEPSDAISVTAEVTRMSAPDLVGKVLPGALGG
jgi:hypothetical protein